MANLILLLAELMKDSFINHSCDGNSWYNGDEKLVACRFIKKGEEITYDYALTESHLSFKLQCFCGKPNCRGTITGDDWKIEELREKYNGHFLEYINKKGKNVHIHTKE